MPSRAKPARDRNSRFLCHLMRGCYARRPSQKRKLVPLAYEISDFIIRPRSSFFWPILPYFCATFQRWCTSVARETAQSESGRFVQNFRRKATSLRLYRDINLGKEEIWISRGFCKFCLIPVSARPAVAPYRSFPVFLAS